MPKYTVTDPTTNKSVTLEGDSPPTEQELNNIFSAVHGPASTPPLTPIGQTMQDIKSSQGVLGTANTLLKAPEKLSGRGLQMMANMVPKPEPTGNLPLDVLKGTPRIAADTVAQVAPGFISKGAILTAGAMKGTKLAMPLINSAGRSIARGAEALSGLEHKTPGVLIEAANNSKLLNSPGTDAASPIYEAAKEIGGSVRQELSGLPEKLKFVKRAANLAKTGELNPTEALEARKELVAIEHKVSGEFFRKNISKFNEIAKPVFSDADTAYAKGVKAEALRSWLPLNKTGGASTFKTILGGAKSLATLGLMSPIVQGGVATGVGAASRAIVPALENAGAVGTTLPNIVKTLTELKAKEYLKKAKNNPDKAREMAVSDGWTIPE